MVSEVFGDIVFLLSAYRDTLDHRNPRLGRFRKRLINFNVFQFATIRGAGILAVSWKI